MGYIIQVWPRCVPCTVCRAYMCRVYDAIFFRKTKKQQATSPNCLGQLMMLFALSFNTGHCSTTTSRFAGSDNFSLSTMMTKSVNQSTTTLRSVFENSSEKHSTRPFRLNAHDNTVVASQISNQLPVFCRVYFACVYLSRPRLTPEWRFHLKHTRSLSYSYTSANLACLPYTLRFNPATQTPDFVQSYAF